MARRPTTTEPQPAKLSKEEVERGIRRLERRIEEVERFDPQSIDPHEPDAATRPLQASIDAALVDTFGHDTIEYRRYRPASFFNYPINMFETPSRYEIVAAIAGERTKSLQLLNAAVELLKERLDHFPEASPAASPAATVTASTTSRKVFIVHGHDDGMKEGVARFLSAIGFDPIILHEQPNKGRTIIHKFREVAQTAGFAVVLLSPDDETTAGQRRARQNVILELGFFLGALGPDRVAALKKGDVETPSDFDGVIYTAYEGNWKSALATELQAVGYDIDWNKVMKP